MYTICKDYRKEIVIEKSRFICTLKKVHSEAEAQEFIKSIKKEFWDATHNCSAYIVDDLAQRSSDDGEPSGTAGIPMLEVLRKNGLTETAAVVTRYFGGIKLGAEGVFVGSGIFKSGDPAKRAQAIVKAVTNFTDAKMLAELSEDLGEAMVGINEQEIALLMAERGK